MIQSTYIFIELIHFFGPSSPFSPYNPSFRANLFKPLLIDSREERDGMAMARLLRASRCFDNPPVAPQR